MATNLIEKGECIFIYDIKDSYEIQFMRDLELVVGEDILQNNADYDDKINDKLVVSKQKVEDAIFDYMSYNFPEAHDYGYYIGKD